MQLKRYNYWQDEEMWIGYLEEYPDYWTQAETENELRINLRTYALTESPLSGLSEKYGLTRFFKMNC